MQYCVHIHSNIQQNIKNERPSSLTTQLQCMMVHIHRHYVIEILFLLHSAYELQENLCTYFLQNEVKPNIENARLNKEV